MQHRKNNAWGRDMTDGKSKKPVQLTLDDDDISTKRIYGRRLVLRGFGGALLGAGVMSATATGAPAADSDKREMGDGKNSFADSKFRDSKADGSDKSPNADY
jgi:hypothetical protein